MRVISGSLRGKKLSTLDSLDVRPTPDAVKEAVFSVIQFNIADALVLDLFGGSGQLGIEALSRGAKRCVFVDKNPAAVEIIKKNLKACRLTGQSEVIRTDSFEYLRKAGRADIILLDPPYSKGLLTEVMPLISGAANDGAFIIAEHERELTLGDEYGDIILHKRYRYGKVAVTIYRKIADRQENP